MLKVTQLEVPLEQVEEEYTAYKEALKRPMFEHEQYLKDLKAIYGHMKHGKKVIDLWASLTKAGLNKDGDPKLAIVQADSKRVRFEKLRGGSGVFYRFHSDRRKWNGGEWVKDITIPDNTFAEWPVIKELVGPEGKQWTRTTIPHEQVRTIVPIIPAKFLNALRGSLKNYHVLFEVKKWEPIPPRDPMLLRQLTPNMFVVLATWDLTPLERAVIKGRIS